MFAPNGHTCDSDLLATLSQRVIMGDGAMGTQLQAADLTLDDFCGLEGCNEILIHREYFEAGADAAETNTFGCNLSNLGDYEALAEEFQLHPEQSTDAFVLHHPEAKYFNT